MAGIRNFPMLEERLARLPAGVRGLRRRAVLALATYDIPRAQIAAVLEIDEAELHRDYLDDLHHAEALLTGNVIRTAWALAESGHWPAISHLLKRMEVASDVRREEQEAERAWQRHRRERREAERAGRCCTCNGRKRDPLS